MLELIYPLEGVAEMLPVTSETAAVKLEISSDEEIFPVVDDGGVVIGRATREYCHGGSHLFHPVVHLHIIDRNQRLYLQKRSMKKDLQPGKWDTAVGGHIRYGETIREALLRESSEEIGLLEFNPIYIDSYRFENRRECELINIFAAVGTYELHPDHDEVDDGRWWPISEIEANLGRGVFTVNFASEFKMIKDQLLALL